MSTVITKKIDGYGPYAYRVEYSDGEHHWEYLGPARGIDENQIELDDERFETVEEVAERIPTTNVEFGDRATANELRDELPDSVLSPHDDRRKKTLELNDEELDRDEKAYIEGRAADTKRRETYQHGQEPLTDAEKRDLDFQKTNVMHARTAKAILQGEGVDDWRAYYDPKLTPSEHVDIAAEARKDSRGQRADRDDARETRQAADQFRAAQGAMADHAREACLDGHDEACAELQEMGIEPPRQAGV